MPTSPKKTYPSSWLVVGATVKGRTQAGPSVDQMAGPACCWDLRWRKGLERQGSAQALIDLAKLRQRDSTL